MKIYIECKSLLLQKSLELFLEPYLSSIKKCDILIRDEKCLEDSRCFYISTQKDSNLVKPFSKSQLILALENRYKNREIVKKIDEIEDNSKNETSYETKLSFDILEKRINSLTQEYQENIIKTIRAFYEK